VSVTERPKAIVLLSGGLDSILTARLLMDQGIPVHGVRFVTPFAGYGVLARRQEEERFWLERYGIPMRIVDLSEEYLGLLTAPPHGFGKRFNPCIDCKILFLRKAKEMMAATGASYVATGEVVGQRPMSQRHHTLRQIEKQSGLAGYLLRPLTALRLPETEPERLGWVDRSRLEGISGRGRERQYELARRFSIDPIPGPGGGCLLTDRTIAGRLFDLREGGRELTLTDALLATRGRHFRLGPAATLVVGRDERENGGIEKIAAGKETLLEAADAEGPTACLVGGADDPATLRTAAALLLRYADHPKGEEGRVTVTSPGGGRETIEVRGMMPEEADACRIGMSK
jgi:hypothetical protein